MQPKLEPKLVSALSETKRLFWLFRFYTETESFAVSIEPKQTEDQPKQFDREHILVFSLKFRVVSVCFAMFRNISVCFDCFDIRVGSKHRNKPKQTETNRNYFFFSRNKPKQNQSRSCFGLFLFEPKICFEDTLIQAFYDDCEGTGRRYASLQHKVLVSQKTPLGIKESILKIRIFFLLVYLKKQCCVSSDMDWIQIHGRS